MTRSQANLYTDDPQRINPMKIKTPTRYLFGNGLFPHRWMALALLLVLGSVAPSLVAQENVTGRVSNAATGKHLEGARVEIQGTGRVAYTDFEGLYRFTQVAPGNINLAISYTGLSPQVVPVAVTAGAANRGDIELTSDIYTLGKMVVAGEREGNALAITLQRQSAGVKSVIATDAFGSHGVNPADLVARLPGVFGDNDGSGIRYIQIRGMDKNLNTTTMDGNRLADAASAGSTREVQFTAISADTIERIEVTKSPTPEMDADSIGGAINFVSKSAFDRKGRQLSAQVGAIYRDQEGVDEFRPNYSISYAEVFGGKFGVAINYGHRSHLSPIPATTRSYQDKLPDPAYTYMFGFEDYHLKQTRWGGGIKLDYKLSDTSRFYFNITRNRMVEPATQHYTYYTTSQTIATRDAAGNLTGTGAVLPEYTKTLSEWRPVAATNVQAYSAFTWKHVTSLHRDIGGVHKFGTLGIDYNLFASDATTHYPHQESVWIRASGIGIRIQDTDKPYFPTVTQTAGPDILNPNSYAENQYDLTHSKGKDSYRGVALNLKKTFEGVAPAYIKAGIRMREQTRDLYNIQRRWNYVGPDGVMGTNAATGINDDNLAQFRNPNVIQWHGLQNYPRLPWLTYPNDDLWVKPFDYTGYDVGEALRKTPNLFKEVVAQRVTTTLNNKQDFKETINAAYLMGNVDIGKLSILGGVRVEETEVVGNGARNEITPAEAALRAAFVGPLTDAEIIRRTTAQYSGRQHREGKYRQVFPGLHFKYEPINGLIVRASYSTNIGRPSIGQLIPQTSVNNDARTISTSNPSLKPQLANNFDLGFEYYFEPAGMISAGVFVKEIRQFIFTRGGNTVQVGADNGFNGDYVGYNLTSQQNGGYGKVRGFEVAYQQQFTFLPGFWKGFGLYANYARNETEGDYGGTFVTKRLAGFIPETANLGISYIRSPYSLRFQFSHAGRRLLTYNASAARLRYDRDRDTLDVKAGYEINRMFSLFLDITNIFGEQERAYEFEGERRQLGYDTGPLYSAGVNARF
jgi:iron complex outermembrane receptor protein